MRIVITGGAGFVGSNLALNLKKENPDAEIIAFVPLLLLYKTSLISVIETNYVILHRNVTEKMYFCQIILCLIINFERACDKLP